MSEGLGRALARMRALARDHLAKALAGVSQVKPEARVAFLPLALVEAYLAAMERRGFDPFRTPVELPQWRRQWRLWRAARSWCTPGGPNFRKLERHLRCRPEPVS